MRCLFPLELEYMGKDRKIPSLILLVVKSKYRSLSLESISQIIRFLLSRVNEATMITTFLTFYKVGNYKDTYHNI